VDASGWHTIEVKLKNRRGEVRARRGYFRGDGTMERRQDRRYDGFAS
jgi:hypothetical protein